MSRRLSTRKQKCKAIKHARRINRQKKVEKKRIRNALNSAEKLKSEAKKRRESNKKKKIAKKAERARQQAKQISLFFNEVTLELMAKACGFLIKKSKLSPLYFLSTLVFSYFSMGDISLILMAANLSDWFGISASAQAISERLRKKSTVNFFKNCLSLSLEKKLKPISDSKYKQHLSIFKGIKVGDSTSIELSESLSKPFKGSGGAASKSALKLNFVYDIYNNLTTVIDIKRGSRSDKKLVNGAVRCIKKGELLIRDLGYFSIDIFKKITKKKAFYISRLLKMVNISLNPTGDPVEIGEFLKKATRNGRNIVDQQVFIGYEKLPARLIAFKTPKWVVKQRIKKFKASHKKEPSEEYVVWCGYSVFITNVGIDMCSAELIVELYTIRWQIELLFKSFKSTLKLDVIRGTSRNSVLCIVYAKLIGIILAEKVISFAAGICAENDRELSVDKAIKWLKVNNKFVEALLNQEMDQLLLRLILYQQKYICKDKRKKDLSTQEKVLSVLQDNKTSFLHKQKKQKAA